MPLTASTSFAAASETSWGVFQFDGVNVRLTPLCTLRSVSPDWNATVTAVSAAGAEPRLTENVALPLSGTLTAAGLTTSVCVPSLSSSAIVAVAVAFDPTV